MRLHEAEMYRQKHAGDLNKKRGGVFHPKQLAMCPSADCGSSNCLISVTPQWDLIRALYHYASTIPFP